MGQTGKLAGIPNNATTRSKRKLKIRIDVCGVIVKALPDQSGDRGVAVSADCILPILQDAVTFCTGSTMGQGLIAEGSGKITGVSVRLDSVFHGEENGGTKETGCGYSARYATSSPVGDSGIASRRAAKIDTRYLPQAAILSARYICSHVSEAASNSAQESAPSSKIG